MKAYLPFFVLALPTLLAAQASYVVFPKGMEKVQGANYDNNYLGRGGKNRTGTTSYVPMHIQTGYALAELGRSALKARILSYRRNNWQRDWMWKSTQTLAVYMSHSPLAPMLYTATFDTASQVRLHTPGLCSHHPPRRMIVLTCAGAGF